MIDTKLHAAEQASMDAADDFVGTLLTYQNLPRFAVTKDPHALTTRPIVEDALHRSFRFLSGVQDVSTSRLLDIIRSRAETVILNRQRAGDAFAGPFFSRLIPLVYQAVVSSPLLASLLGAQKNDTDIPLDGLASLTHAEIQRERERPALDLGRSDISEKVLPYSVVNAVVEVVEGSRKPYSTGELSRVITDDLGFRAYDGVVRQVGGRLVVHNVAVARTNDLPNYLLDGSIGFGRHDAHYLTDLFSRAKARSKNFRASEVVDFVHAKVGAWKKSPVGTYITAVDMLCALLIAGLPYRSDVEEAFTVYRNKVQKAVQRKQGESDSPESAMDLDRYLKRDESLLRILHVYSRIEAVTVALAERRAAGGYVRK